MLELTTDTLLNRIDPFLIYPFFLSGDFSGDAL